MRWQPGFAMLDVYMYFLVVMSASFFHFEQRSKNISFKNIRDSFGVQNFTALFVDFVIYNNSFVLFSGGWRIRKNNNTLLLFNRYYFHFSCWFQLLLFMHHRVLPNSVFTCFRFVLLCFVWFFVHFLECTNSWSLFLIPFNIRLQYKFKKWIL